MNIQGTKSQRHRTQAETCINMSIYNNIDKASL